MGAGGEHLEFPSEKKKLGLDANNNDILPATDRSRAS